MPTRCFDRKTPADQMLSCRKAWAASPGIYKVLGRQGNPYTLVVSEGYDIDCGCLSRGTCWHVATVARRLLREGVRFPALEATR